MRLEDFEARIRALEGWRAEKAGEERLAGGQELEKPGGFRERRVSTISAGAGGVVAVIVRVLGGKGGGRDDRRNALK